MKEKTTYISTKQYRIALSFSLVMIFTTSSVPLWFSCFLEMLLLLLINVPVFKNIGNKRVCWGIYLFSVAVIGEIVFFLNQVLPFTVPGVSFVLLPGTTFMFLLAPLFDLMSNTDEKKNMPSSKDLANGFVYYLVAGIVISMLRELLGYDTFCGIHLGIIKNYTVEFVGHSSGAALLIVLGLMLLRILRNADTGENWVLDTKESETPKYRPISVAVEKKYFTLCLCMLLYDVIFGGIGVAVIFYAPDFLRKREHIIVFATLVTLLLFTLIVKGFKQSDTLDENRYVPLLLVIQSSLPMIYFMSHLMYSVSEEPVQRILWWGLLVLAVWLSSTMVMFYSHVIYGRFLFGKQPRCMQGVPFVILHILLALIVFIPWMEIISRI